MNNACFECGKKAKHNHHVIPQSLGGTKTIPLCEKHHGIIHGITFSDHGNLTKVALHKLRRYNKRYSRHPPYGYEYIGDTLKINPAEAKGLRLIKDLYKKDYGPTRIAKELSARGFLSRTGKQFDPATVYRIIKKNRL
jgi:hypothetical protein